MKQLDLFGLDDEDFVPAQELLHTHSEGKNKMRKPLELPLVKTRAIATAVNTLNAIGCVYKIILPTGAEIMRDPDNALNKRKHTINRDELPYGYGDLKRHYLPYVQNMQVGDVTEIPYNENLPAVSLQSSLSAHLSKVWGNGTYTTATNKIKKVIELLRVA